MKSSITILFFVLSLELLCAQSAKHSIHASITDGKLLPLEGANVILLSIDEDREYGGSSDLNGNIFIDDIVEGKYELIVSYIGYFDFIKELNIVEKTEIIVEMNVQPIVISELEIISENDKKNIVGTITSINSETLESIKPMGTQEILEYVPGINGFSDDGIGNSRINIGIRGINPRRSSRVLVLEDGIPIQPAIYVYPNMYYNPPVERISKVEVVKGSASILYGPQTMGGVVNYLTKKPSNNNRPKVKITGGENGYFSAFYETGTFNRIKFKPEIQLLFKRGDGYRDNNSFYQYNVTLKLSYNRTKNENLYLKTNFNYENSNATYTGLTLYSYIEDPNSNYKENDNFELYRASTDIIHTKKLNKHASMTNSVFISYFNRDWWREDDIFLDAEDFENGEYNILGSTQSGDKIRHGNGFSSSGRLRKFFVLGSEKKYTFKDIFLPINNTLEIGGRIYFERFIDDGQKGYSPDSREGLYFVPPEEYIDLNGNGVWDPSELDSNGEVVVSAEEFTDCSTSNPYICEGSSDWSTGLGDGEWTDAIIVGQSHIYESIAFSAFISQIIELNSSVDRKFVINPGFRFELFEQERIDRLNGAQYQDKTTFIALPGIGFNKQYNWINIFGGIHRGFTPPSTGSLKILNFGDNVNSDALELDAEKSWNKEIGIRANNNFLDMELAFFHVDIENMVAAGRMVEFKNLGKVNNMGIELGSNIYLSNINSVIPNMHLSYTFLKTEIKEGVIATSYPRDDVECVFIDEDGECHVSISGNELPYAPKHSLTIGTSLKVKHFFNGEFQIRLDYKYIESFYTDFENIKDDNTTCFTENDCSQNPNETGFISGYQLGIVGPVPAYGIFNLSSKYTVNQKFSISLAVKNLLDKIYIASRLHSHPARKKASESSGIIPGPRRQINVSLEYIF